MLVTLAAGDDDVDAAALIWAQATAARDGDREPASLGAARAVIDAVLARSRHECLLVAKADDGPVAGFAIAGPVGPGRAEVSYLGVRPDQWGTGVGSLLLAGLRERLAAAGYQAAELLVYVANERAVALYERHGWRPAGPVTPHPRTGKPEQRYELVLAGRAAWDG